MDMQAIGEAWQRALMQFVDTASPFGQAKLVASVILLLAILVGMASAAARRPGLQTSLETWLAGSMGILIGLNTIDALTVTLSLLLSRLTGRSLGGVDRVDRIRIRWPTGESEAFGAVETVDRQIILRQGEGEAQP